ncbi:phosphotransferase [Nocardia nepalensis]|uniref:phosphotransferase n=1 Tax=Nocardia nepalensis TaxID=3375448 RepID=UPI003B66D0F8
MIDSGLPGRDALGAVCAEFGVAGAEDAVMLHHRSNAVWLVGSVVVRLAPATELRCQRATAAVAVTRWLSHVDDPIALTPLPGPQPVIASGAVATFWPYRPTQGSTDPATLGALVRRLHEVGDPPQSAPIPAYRPLLRLGEALDIDQGRTRPALSATDRMWLRSRADDLVAAFADTQWPLGIGLIHADAHSGNAVRDGAGWVLIDWDGTSTGPRELDLIGTVPDHFHESDCYRQQFAAAYGYDMLTWPGWVLLRDIVELHSIGSYIRLAPDKPAAANELHRRVRSLRSGDRSVLWRPVH